MSLAFSSDLGPLGGSSEPDVVNKEIYYLRAFYATVFLTLPSNHIFLSRHNSSFLTALFDSIYTALRPSSGYNYNGEKEENDYGNSNLTVHYPLILHLYNFYLSVLPSLFTYHMLNNNLFH